MRPRAATPHRQRSAAGDATALGEGQYRVLELIASGAPLGETLECLVRLIETDIPGVVGSILLLDDDGVRLRHGAAPSLPTQFLRAIGPRAGSCGTAAYLNQSVIVEDIERDPLWADYRQLAAPHGLCACWSMPIRDADRRMLGTFALYLREPGSPAARHRRVIEIAKHTAAIAILKAKGEGERLHLMNDLAERVKELTVLHDAARLLQSGLAIEGGLLVQLAAKLPAGWRYPESCEARIVYGEIEARTPAWRESPWMLAARFATGDGRSGSVEVAYLDERPAAAEGPFLAEERSLLQSFTDMLAAHLERVRVQGALTESEAVFRSIFENAAIGITMVSMQEAIVRCNPAFARMLGYTEDELAGRTFSELTHVEDVEANRKQYRSLRDGRVEHFRLRKRYIHKDGRTVWAQRPVSLARLAGSGPRFTIGMVEDITARKEAEEEVRRLAYYDTLTNLPNRALLQARLARAVEEARAHNLGLQVTAEGVENVEACRELKTLGCDLAQGCYFARPMPVEQITPWLKASPWRLGGARRDHGFPD